MRFHNGQGATEYLVLLAVVLIVALVSVALLGFFPGMASDAQMTQSQMYWQSASPIAITETAARAAYAWGTGTTMVYMKIRNTGSYPVRITKFLGGTSSTAYQYLCKDAMCGGVNVCVNMTDWYYLNVGEEMVLGRAFYFGDASLGMPTFSPETIGYSGTWFLLAASSVCQNATVDTGTLAVKNFGFEYIEYIGGQQITKRQVGKDLIIKCRERI